MTQDYLGKIPLREAIRKRLDQRCGTTRNTRAPYQGRQVHLLRLRNTGLQSQYGACTGKLGAGAPEVFLDPNTFSKDGTTSAGGHQLHPRRQPGGLPDFGGRLRLAQSHCD
ncbi:MAG: hypothetical protein WKG07_38565 [Hymenobacter sp.]